VSQPAEVTSQKNCAWLSVGCNCGGVVLCAGLWARVGFIATASIRGAFGLESSDNIEVTGMQNVTKAQIMEVMARISGAHLFHSAVAAEDHSWSRSVGGVGERDAVLPSPEGGDSRADTVAFAEWAANFLIDAGGTLNGTATRDISIPSP